MKKFWKTMMFAALGVFALSSCEDVPAPYDIPSGGGGETPAIIEPAGDGTLESPYNVAAANEACSALQQSNTSETYLSDVVYVKGVISQIDNVDPSYGNSTYYISDSGLITDQLEVYRGFYLDGARFTAADQIAVGDTVIVCGQLQNWLGRVNEFTSGSKIVYHNGASSEPDTPAGIEVTCAQAVELTNALEDNATSTEVYTVTGYITEVVGNVSRNQQTFWMADEKDGGNVFEAYWANLPEGVSAFKAGSKVKITGNLTKYVNNNGQVTAEIKNATVEILDEGGSDTPDTPDTPDVGGNSITFSEMGYENAQDFNGESITVGDATLTWSKGSGSTTPKYYNTGTGMRLYGSNTLTIASNKTISKVEFTYDSGADSNSRPYYATNSNTSFTPGTYDYDAQAWNGSAKSIVMSYTGQGGHVRIQSITITYAE